MTKLIVLSCDAILHPRDPGWSQVPREQMFQTLGPAAIARMWSDKVDNRPITMLELCNGVVLRALHPITEVRELVNKALA